MSKQFVTVRYMRTILVAYKVVINNKKCFLRFKVIFEKT